MVMRASSRATTTIICDARRDERRLFLRKSFFLLVTHSLVKLAIDSLKIVIDQARAALAQTLKLILKLFEILIREIFEIDHTCACALDATQQLIELEVHRLSVAILRILDQEHHQECDDRRPGIYN